MKILLQRVDGARVEVDSRTVGAIEGKGLLALVGFGADDTEETAQTLALKMLHLRIFPDEKGRFDKSLLDISGAVLLVPQFTLYADTSKGRRPEFFSAMSPGKAENLFSFFCTEVKKIIGHENVAEGVFGADMKVSLCNDGPVTIMLES
jgi:D-tyrosyl-tRNA(Tyr) deacylase